MCQTCAMLHDAYKRLQPPPASVATAVRRRHVSCGATLCQHALTQLPPPSRTLSVPPITHSLEARLGPFARSGGDRSAAQLTLLRSDPLSNMQAVSEPGPLYGAVVLERLPVRARARSAC